jgi:hypothetical protein
MKNACASTGAWEASSSVQAGGIRGIERGGLDALAQVLLSKIVFQSSIVFVCGHDFADYVALNEVVQGGFALHTNTKEKCFHGSKMRGRRRRETLGEFVE